MRSPEQPSNVGLAILLLIALAAVAGIARPTNAPPARPCADLHPVTVGGSMVVGCQR